MLDTFLKEQGVNKEPEEIKEEPVQVCVVCERETESVYRDKLVCVNCKR